MTSWLNENKLKLTNFIQAFGSIDRFLLQEYKINSDGQINLKLHQGKTKEIT
jgi:hypothetical protein